MSGIPPGWRWVALDEMAGGVRSNLVIGPFGSSLKVSDYRAEGVPLIFVRNIRTNDFARAAGPFIEDAKALELGAHQARAGDVLITKMGDPPGDAAVYRGRPAIITADCIRLRVSRDFIPEYVAHAFSSPEVRRQMAQITRGVAQRKVSLSRLREAIRLPVPPVEEQRRIVGILEDHLSRLDAGLAGLRRGGGYIPAFRLSALSEVRRTLLDSGAPLMRISDVASTALGKMLDAKKAVGDPTPYLRNINVRWSAFNLDDVATVALTADERERLALRSGDLLVCEGGEPGRCAVWPGGDSLVAYQKALHRVRALDPERTDMHFVAGMLEEFIRAGRADRMFTGTTIKHLPQEKLRLIEIPMPFLARQKVAVAHLRGLDEASSRLRVELISQAIRADALRRALLATAFSGRLAGRPSDVDVVEEFAGV